MAWTSLSCFDDQRVLTMLHLVSFVLLYLPTGVSWYFGNLVVYLNSYWYIVQNAQAFNSQWVISNFCIFWGIGVIVGGFLVKRIGRRIICFLGVVIFDLGIFMGRYSVEHSQVAFIVTFGTLTGIGLGFVNVDVYTRVPRLDTNKSGLAFSILHVCFSIGAIIFAWVATRYTNPNDAAADVLVLGHFKVFKDKSVIERVPGMFFAMGYVAALFHVIGLLLTFALKDKGLVDKISVSTMKDTKDGDGVVEDCASLKQHAKHLQGDESDRIPAVSDKTAILASDYDGMSQYYLNGSIEKSTQEESRPLSTATFQRCYTASYGQSAEEEEMIGHSDQTAMQPTDSSSKEASSNEDLNPFQMIKTLRFYVVWFTVFANDASYVALFNFYKIFGELWISDDYFLTQLATASFCFVILVRMMWAVVIDKFTPKGTQIALTFSMCLAFSFYYFTPQLNRWLFAMWTCLTAALCSAVYLNFSIITLNMFGESYFASNYGVMSTATIVLNLLAPQIFAVLIKYFSWSGVFLSAAILNAIALVATLLGLSNKR